MLNPNKHIPVEFCTVCVLVPPHALLVLEEIVCRGRCRLTKVLKTEKISTISNIRAKNQVLLLASKISKTAGTCFVVLFGEQRAFVF